MKVTDRTIEGIAGVYQQSIEAAVVERLAEALDIDAAQAMNVYYRSRLSRQVAEGKFGIQFLSADCLVEDLLENEPELVEGIRR